MNYDDILKKINKLMAERLMKEQDRLFGQAHQRQQESYAAFKAQQEARARQGMSDDRAQAFAFGRAGMNMGAGTTFTVDMNSPGPERLIWPSDGKEITLSKGDYRVVEEDDDSQALSVL